MCECRKLFEEKAVEHFPEIEGAAATLSGYMLIPSGFQYLECEVKGFRALGKYCMFCGEPFKGAE